MGLPSSSISGATFQNLLLNKRQAKLAKAALSNKINQTSLATESITAPNLPSSGADTIFAGTPSLLISMGGVDTLGAGRDVLHFRSGREAVLRAPGNTPPENTLPENTPMGGANISFAAAGNLTLLGGGDVALPVADASASDSLSGAAGGIATLFGAAMAGSTLVFDQGPDTAPRHAQDASSVAGGVPDLLLGWSFTQPGTMLDFHGTRIAGQGNRAQLRDGTDIHLSSLPETGTMEIIFPKQS